MIRLLKKLHRHFYFASVFLVFCLFFPLLWFYAKNPEKNYNKIGILRKWMSLLGSYFVGIFYSVKLEEEIDWTKPFILCANHTSILDITALTYISPVPFSFIGKAELLKNPVTRIFFKTIDIPVDRKSRMSSFRSFKKANDRLQEGKSLAIFPEGKIDDVYPPTLHEFKSGAFRMAIDNNIPIIPIVIENAWKILWDDGRRLGSHPGIVHIQVLAPINTEQYSEQNAEKLEDYVYNKMLSHWILQNKS
ncbi:1-acyl-sn-glycerol-3-phosphate acyltransferase [Sphingobacterium sp. SRCM116780]|uniref:lysophospholipid acyltransferase family protein n=1 Tax=Sphingobacterium sp. SRCM116780 TaxID=2907623 RepID=UPI001F467242|nr:lysophospholipid acyltransferase family protein [Sphingobacterium sp. SRCM116780]UIR55171.1 1-acyl-sn-glycerol-3-phosphate acyltransferase [Sphingobacterium sp. SRCM116780]